MRHITASLSFLCFISILPAKDTPLIPPKKPSEEQALAFGRIVTERRQRLLVAELEEVAASNPQVCIYTINPIADWAWAEEGEEQWVDTFRIYPILGKANVTNPEDRRALLRALIKGIRESDGTVAACFAPRHALTITAKTKTIDILVCFHCLSGQAWGAYGANSFLTTATPQLEFDRIVGVYKLPNPKR